MRVLLLYNTPILPADHPDVASELGVLESVAAMQEALSAVGYHVDRLGLGADLDFLLQRANGPDRPDVVVNFCEGFGGDPALEAHVAAVLELLRLPFTGATAETLWLTRDKARTKFLLAAAGLPAPAGLKVAAGPAAFTLDGLARHQVAQRLGPGPWFVKPAAQDASLGIGPDSVVTDLAALCRQVELVRARYGDVLIEPYLAGREFNISVIAGDGEGSGSAPRVLPLAEVRFELDPQRRWPIVTYAAKWSPESSDWNSTPVTCPADVDAALEERLRVCAAQTFRELGCRDYARVDLRLDAQGSPWILEVNVNPDLSPGAGFARSLLAAGISYGQFACQLVAGARARGSAGSTAV